MLKLCVPLPGERHSSCESSATHSYQCVLYFHMSKQCYGCRYLGFLTCAQMLMRVVAQGAVETTQGSALKIDRVKNPLRHQGLEPMSVLHLAFQSAELSPLQKITAPKNQACGAGASVHQQQQQCRWACRIASNVLFIAWFAGTLFGLTISITKWLYVMQKKKHVAEVQEYLNNSKTLQSQGPVGKLT